MARIRSKHTSPEKTLRKELHRLGLRFRLNVKKLPGKPDLVFARYHTALFVHGCFWHRHHGCKVASNPKSNTAFWQTKFARNQTRDKDVAIELARAGWRVIVVWECEIQKKKVLPSVAERIATEIRRGTHSRNSSSVQDFP